MAKELAVVLSVQSILVAYTFRNSIFYLIDLI